ncbi:oxidoreductase [Neobacillus bataviensis LMG 21833]|uniref:Oxidoreductase n=1 Tax=Neobacillus bataviensis LMG 21833 TaxID=1117379 RepID=K6D3I4_9BACI|nr:oxidoreductase [Neobacillus bataviensis LMG 21833]
MVKNIVITGATGDIAKEIVSLLSKTNDHLILVSRSAL